MRIRIESVGQTIEVEDENDQTAMKRAMELAERLGIARPAKRPD